MNRMNDEPRKDERAHLKNGPILDDRDCRGHHSDDLWRSLGGAHVAPQQAVANGPHRAGHHKHHRHHHRRRKPASDAANSDDADQRILSGPAQRVQFLLHPEGAAGDDDNAEIGEPHRIFTEMEELFGSGEELRWRETARWIKFEEDVEEGGNRWSKPHVATLSLHALFELRSCLLNGLVALDVDAHDLSSIVDIILDKLIAAKQLQPELREQVRDTLLRRHTHQYEQLRHKDSTHRGFDVTGNNSQQSGGGGFLPLVRSLAEMGRSFSHSKNLNSHGSSSTPAAAGHSTTYEHRDPVTGQQTLSLPKPSSVPRDLTDTGQVESNVSLKRNKTFTVLEKLRKDTSAVPLDMFGNVAKVVRKGRPFRGHSRSSTRAHYPLRPPLNGRISASSSALPHMARRSNQLNTLEARFISQQQGNLHFMKKIPPGSESSNVLIGEVNFLPNHIACFIRLQNAVLLGDLTEVPVPTRFMFILLGPKGHGCQYKEVGRAMATLMSDEVFHDVAYKARNTNDLLDGVDEFLDQVTVLPPGEWDPNIRIEPPTNIPSQEKRKQVPEPEKKEDENEEEEALAGGHGMDPTLRRTGRLFGGLIADIKRKLPWYGSDFKDALQLQCLASFFFMYFAMLAPIITFGGLLEEATGRYMASIENLLSGAVCGSLYCLFSGQPLTMIGSTGPVLVFEAIMFDMSEQLGVYYMSVRWWIGLWSAVILILMVATDASALVSYITRFTEESFSCLISLIFIVEAFKKLYAVYQYNFKVSVFPAIPITDENRTCVCIPPWSANFTTGSIGLENVFSVASQLYNKTASYSWIPNALVPRGVIHWHTEKFLVTAEMGDLNETEVVAIDWNYVPLEFCEVLKGSLQGSSCYHMYDVFLMSLALTLFTFTIAFSLKALRNSCFFPARLRTIVSDFAVMIAIVVMVLVDYFVGLDTPKLNVPSEFTPTAPKKRGWVIGPFDNGNPWWTCLFAIPPSLLACILLFMDQQITAVIVNRKENKLKKGCGYHLDLFVLALLIMLCSVLGLPYFVAATVMAVTHVNSLRVESECKAPGEVPKFVGVREQRVTGLLVFIFIGLSTLMTDVLRLIPMPVLYGVFLYMGVSSLRGVQLVDRLLLFFMPMKYQPDYVYLRHVPVRRVHLFTFIQVCSLAMLWIIKTIKKTSIAFPVMLVVMVGVRKAMEWIFDKRELGYLDDHMPEIHLRKKEDAKKAIEAKLFDDDHGNDGLQLKPVKTDQNIHVPLPTGNVLKIPIPPKTNKPERPINLTEEVNKSGLWKHIESESSIHSTPPYRDPESAIRQRHMNHPEERPDASSDYHRQRRNIDNAGVSGSASGGTIQSPSQDEDDCGFITIKIDRSTPTPTREAADQKVPLLSKLATSDDDEERRESSV